MLQWRIQDQDYYLVTSWPTMAANKTAFPIFQVMAQQWLTYSPVEMCPPIQLYPLYRQSLSCSHNCDPAVFEVTHVVSDIILYIHINYWRQLIITWQDCPVYVQTLSVLKLLPLPSPWLQKKIIQINTQPYPISITKSLKHKLKGKVGSAKANKLLKGGVEG